MFRAGTGAYVADIGSATGVGGRWGEGGRGGIDWGGDTSDRLYKAPTDYTKPRNIRQSPRNIIQSLEY